MLRRSSSRTWLGSSAPGIDDWLEGKREWSAMNDPTPEEIARVAAYQERQREEQWRSTAHASAAKRAENIQRIVKALRGQTILAVEVEGMNSEGEISMRDGHLQLGLSSGQILTVSVGGWHEPYLSVEVKDIAE